MAVEKNAVYKVHNGVDFDEINFKTIASQVKMASGIDLESGFTNSKSANGYTKLPNGIILQWIEVDVNFTTAQYQDVSITMPMGFSSGGAFGFASCITNSTSAKYTTAAVTTTNSLAGAFLLRVATTQTINATLKFKILAIGY